MARELHLIVVGKLRDSHLEAIEADYLKRINNPPLLVHEVKASAENKTAEGEALLKRVRELGISHLIALSEWGKKRTSVEFAGWTKDLIENHPKAAFLIAGAEGFSEEVLGACRERVSLSDLTYPHKLARILIIEQIYRAQTIRTGHPYHN